MATYRFDTTATMKKYNTRKWWIDSGIIRPITVTAETLVQALAKYQEEAAERYGVTISKNALATKSEMYQDTADGEAVQCGYVITGSTEFEGNGWQLVKQYIDLWVTVSVIVNPFVEVQAC